METSNKLYWYAILSILANDLFDVYYPQKNTKGYLEFYESEIHY